MESKGKVMLVYKPHIARTFQDTNVRRHKGTKKRRQVNVGVAVTIGIAPTSQLPQDTLFQP